MVANKASSNFTSMKVIKWSDRTCTRLRHFLHFGWTGVALLSFCPTIPTMSLLSGLHLCVRISWHVVLSTQACTCTNYVWQKWIHPPSFDATKQRPGFTSGWLPFIMASNILLNVCFTGPPSLPTVTQSLLSCLWICLKKRTEVISVITNY